ncbi:hypothetical protein MLD38_004348 [Melastoma candidum]|uniref:Uncharacterized protein n=1 Tax=Melastoma candidum TaxID=119954 RepID=A0ACB9S4M7_9MYRT|nr:hypothetical protein MLD38_004348 [Melastoma candidum]
MCGIALLALGIRIGCSPAEVDADHALFSVEDIKGSLSRRGPDSLGVERVLLHREDISLGHAEEHYAEKRAVEGVNGSGDALDEVNETEGGVGELVFIGATLQLRGVRPVVQPLVDDLGNLLVYNGEIFGGFPIDNNSNDGEVLMQYLGGCCSHSCEIDQCLDSFSCHRKKQCTTIPDALSRIKGPWAVIYWQESTKTVWFGRDAFGRRSLLVHWPSREDPRLLLSSVSPPISEQRAGCKEERVDELKFWEELTCGIYSMTIKTSKNGGFLVGEINRHEWRNSVLKELICWERVFVVPNNNHMNFTCNNKKSSDAKALAELMSIAAEKVLAALRVSVRRRSSFNKNFQGGTCGSHSKAISLGAPVAVLFSGGLDSMIIAALLDQYLDPQYEIDLLNVSFDGPLAPDRISARAGQRELRKIAPSRRWRLIEVDAELSNLGSEMQHVVTLIHPANTYMDLNIGTALWLVARGDGWICEATDEETCEHPLRHKYESRAKILLVGSGADEQCAGYGRHKTKYRHGSWHELDEEMRLDMQRIWKRNMGRDDRCIADNGKEARFPFLDEDVIKVLLDMPLWEIADLDLPSGVGDKKILREVARLLGLTESSVRPKRAIQFGSRIARESNRKNFGSNRAANQASAGSVAFGIP